MVSVSAAERNGPVTRNVDVVVGLLVGWLIGWSVCVVWLFGCLVVRLVGCSVGWLFGWLVVGGWWLVGGWLVTVLVVVVAVHGGCDVWLDTWA